MLCNYIAYLGSFFFKCQFLPSLSTTNTMTTIPKTSAVPTAMPAISPELNPLGSGVVMTSSGTTEQGNFFPCMNYKWTWCGKRIMVQVLPSSNLSILDFYHIRLEGFKKSKMFDQIEFQTQSDSWGIKWCIHSMIVSNQDTYLSDLTAAWSKFEPQHQSFPRVEETKVNL